LANNNVTPDTALVFAAGFGKRMQPITNKIPKPLVKVNNKSLIDYALDNLSNAGIKRAVVNTHYLAEKIQGHLKKRNTPPKTSISHEDPILETGGGIVRALLKLGSKPFFTINSDIIITNGNENALKRLSDFWNPDKMDVLMLLHDKEKAVGYDGTGDFNLSKDNHIIKPDQGDCKYVFTGVMIIKPEIFKGVDEKPFSVYRDFIHLKYRHNDGSLSRVYGIEHDGKWLHIGTPEGIGEAEKALNK